MNNKRLLILLAIIFALSVPAFAGEGLDNVLGIEAGYGYVVSQADTPVLLSHGILPSLYYGYVIGDKPKSMTVLSIVLGYGGFPSASTAIHSMVYGLEYAHTFFRQSPVSLLLDYGLLFNLILQYGREGNAFGHHTRLGAGAVFNVSDRHKISAKLSYNIVTFPYFELAAGRFSYPALHVRYSFLF